MIVIVGDGVTGLSAAFWLARAGHAVTVLEKGVIGWEASGRKGGGCTHPMSPLFREEQRLWPILDELLGAPTEWRPDRIKIALDETELARLRAQTALATAQGFRAEELDLRTLRSLVPWIGDEPAGALFWHFGGHANPHRTVQAYAWAVARQGGTVLQHTPALGIKVSAGRAVAVVTPRGEIGCDAVLIAAGPGTAGHAATVGVRLPLALARVEMLATEPLPRLAHGGVDGHGLYGRQSLRGNLLYGGGPHEWLDRDDEGPPPRHVGPVMAGLARRLVQLFPRLGHVRVVRAWSGVVETTPDGRPVLERLAEPRNVTIATMSSVGFGLSPAAGRALAELVTEGRCSFANLSSLARAVCGPAGGLARTTGSEAGAVSLEHLDVVMLGEGVVGVATAFDLTRLGCRRVLRLERSRSAEGRRCLYGDPCAAPVRCCPRERRPASRSICFARSGDLVEDGEADAAASARDLPPSCLRD